MHIICPNCGTRNDSDARFCKNCGHRLAPDVGSDPGRSRRPTPTVEDDNGERRVVTVLFCDVADSTYLASSLDPEEWAIVMDDAFDFMILPVERYGGNVARLMGDGILAFFGAPSAHEDDPLRAVLAAVDIMAEIKPFRQRLRSDYGLDLNLRIGINTGPAVVGQIGTTVSSEYTAMGDAVNLAARMEQTASPGTIRISQSTFRLVEPHVRAESLGPVEVKGKREPIPAYRIVGIREERVLRPGVETRRSPLTGRDHEITQLRGVLKDLYEGRGQVLLLIGEAGIGKSRLVQELKLLAADVNGNPTGEPEATLLERWIEAESLSFETMQPYGLIRRQLRRIFGIAQEDPPNLIRRKVARLAGQFLPGKQERVQSVLAALFGLEPLPDERLLQGEELKQALFDCVSSLVRAWTSAGPSVLFFEDLHWADLASADLVGHLLSLVEELPILILCAFRPERTSPAWLVRRTAKLQLPHRLVEISLSPLSDEESTALAGSLLEFSQLPTSVGNLILERAQGIPYFVEEIVQDLIERGQVVRVPGESSWQLSADHDSLHIPENLEAILVARMDRLEEGPRRTLQVAAVIGRSFYFRVLELVADGSEKLDRQLRVLQRAGMIEAQPDLPELQYKFRHALAQEAAYNTILLRIRRRIHQRTGEVMEQVFAGQLEEQAPLLARHFRASGDFKRALHYLSLAARSAIRLYANREAVTHYSDAIEVAALLPATIGEQADLHRGRSQAYEILGDFNLARADLEIALMIGRQAVSREIEWRSLLELGKLWASRDYGQAGNYFREALSLARSLGDPAALARSLNRLGNLNANAERPQESLRYHQEALEIALNTGEERLVAATYDLLGMASTLGGDSVAGVSYFRQAINYFRRQGDRRGLASSLVALGVSTGSFHSVTLVAADTPEVGLAATQEALSLTWETRWRGGEAFALWANAALYARLGRYAMAMESARASLDLANRIEHRQWMAAAHNVLGCIFDELFDPDEARLQLEKALALSREVGSQYWFNQSSAFLARAYLGMDEAQRAREILDPLTSPGDPMQSSSQRNCWLIRAELALAQDNPQMALDVADQLIGRATNLTPGRIIPGLWVVRAAALLALGQSVEARDHLLQVTASKDTDVSLRWRAHAALGRLHPDANQPHVAQNHLQAATHTIESLAAGVPDERLKERYRQGAYRLVPLD